jgi:hypothetical protein
MGNFEDDFLFIDDDNNIIDNTEDKKDEKKDEKADLEDNTILVEDEEEEIEEEEEEGEEKEDTEEEEEDTDETLVAWTEEFKKIGLISETLDSSEIKSFDDLITNLSENYQSSVAEGIESYLEGVDERAKEYAELKLKGFSKEALDSFDKLVKQEIVLESLDKDKIEKDPEIAKELMRSYYKKTTKFNDARIEKEITRLVELEEITNEAISVLPEYNDLIKEDKEKLKKQKDLEDAKASKDKEDLVNKYKNKIKETKEIIKGINISDKEKLLIEKELFNPTGKNKRGEFVNPLQEAFDKDPENVNIILNYLALKTKGFSNWEFLEKEYTNKVSKDIDNKIFTKKPNEIKKTTKTKKETNSILDLIRGKN